MNRFAPSIAAGLLALSGVVTVAIAEDVPLTSVPEPQPVPFSEEPSLLYATELIQRADLYARAIGEMSDVPEVQVLKLSNLPRADASPVIFQDTLNRFRKRYRSEIAALRAAMEGNPVVANALDESGVEISDIMAAEIGPDLALRVYVP